MDSHTPSTLLRLILVAALLALGPIQGVAVAQSGGSDVNATATDVPADALQHRENVLNRSRISQEQREAAALRMKLMRKAAEIAAAGAVSVSAAELTPADTVPGGVPDYFGSPDASGRPVANWAWSPPLRKFVDSLPGVGPQNANNLGNFIGVAHPDTVTYPGSDYYEIELREYEQQLHSDMPPTRLRGYVQVNNGTDPNVANPTLADNTVTPDPITYLGPSISATKDRPVRVKFTNKLPVGEGGDLFIPVDTSVMGAGMGPLGMDAMPMNYTQNRATLHLHGGITPWISDGTPHQWITPAGEDTPYPEGVSARNVPDMPDPGDGSMTFFYTNQQSARLMWYHDHAYGITRLNVYAGEVAPYVLTDGVEQQLIADGIIPGPADTIPLIVQDKTFVDAATILTTDPTWNWGSTPPYPHTGDLWMPHVYVPAQNPADPGGMNPTGRWHFGPWFWPPTTDIEFPPDANPYYDPLGSTPWEYPLKPATPNPSMGMEAFHDTPLVNGVAYPTVTVDPKTYRLRILNGASDRFFNLQMYTADPAVIAADGRANTEVKMVPAVPTPAYDAAYPDIVWPADGRQGGAPDPATAGPEWVQIGTESGFLPAPAIIPQQPITWNADPTTFNVGNVQDHSLLVAPAERADVIVDFSAYAGQTLILYNDAPTAFPALDQRTDYYTGAPDFTETGGTTTTPVGYGPNTRTVMQIKVAASAPAPAYDRAALVNEFVSTGPATSVFDRSQNSIIIPDARYEQAYDNAVPFVTDPYVRIFESLQKTWQLMDGSSVTLPLEPKAIQDEMGEAFERVYGRMSGNFGLQIPGVGGVQQNLVLYGFLDPPTENLTDQMSPESPVLADGTQIWRITHNGVDTHPVHFHLYDVQLINRVGWDGALRPPDDNELGWKETVRVSPLEDTIVALKPVAPKVPYGVPDSIRPLDPTMPLGTTEQFSPFNELGQPRTVTNSDYNFTWEYVFHCHILSHEEMDMMRPVTVAVAKELPAAPNPLSASGTSGSPVTLTWVDATPPNPLVPLTVESPPDPTQEVGFRIERAPLSEGGAEGTFEAVATADANSEAFIDTTTVPGRAYRYRVVAFNATEQDLETPTYAPPTNTADILPIGDTYFDSWVVTPSAGPNGSITPSTPQSVLDGNDSPTFTFTPDPGYHVADVTVDDSSIGAPGTHTITGVTTDREIHVTFAVNEYEITPSVVGGNGRIVWNNIQNPVYPPADPMPAPLVQHDVMMKTFAFLPDPGFEVAEVLVDGVPVPPAERPWDVYTFGNVTGTHTISVSFQAQTFTITPSASAGGTITPATPQVLSAGANQTFTMTPNTGYVLSELIVDGAPVVPATSTYTFTNVLANHTIAATFIPQTFTITPSAGVGGSISPATPQTVSYGTASSAFVITPLPGFVLSELIVDGAPVAPATSTYTFTNVTANHTIAATFVAQGFVIAPSASIGGSITPATPQVVTYGGTSPVFTIAANPGYRLTELRVDGVVVAITNSYSFTNVTADHTIQATFTADRMMPVYRFYNMANGSHFYTASAGERDHVIATWPSVYSFEGTAYTINLDNPANVDPLYRFYNNINGSHFYTASPVERDVVIVAWPGVYTFEGVAYNVAATAGANTTPVYRFYNARSGSHFYTISTAERDHVIATWPTVFSYEGVAFFVGY